MRLPIAAAVGSSGVLVWFIASLVVNYPSLLLHELGHAAVALQQTSGPVVVQVGSSRDAKRASFGRLGVSLSLRGCGGVCLARNDRPLSRAAQLKRVLAGPAVNLVLALLFGALALRTHGLVRVACGSAAFTNAAMVVLNLIPRHARGSVNQGRPNDGLKAWCLLRGKPIPPPSPPKPGPAKASPRASGRRRVTGGAIGMTLGIVAIGGMVLTGRIPVETALIPLVTVAIFAWLADASVRASRRRAAAPSNTTSVAPTLKRCPSCGAEVYSRAKLCYCDHEFS